jgi:2-C-methyl-D-erythritol 4-phosphate cytidylyltransferase
MARPRIRWREKRRNGGAGPRAAAVVLAGGSGVRLGGSINKVYLPLAGRRVVSWSLAAFTRITEVGRIVLVIRPEDEELVRRLQEREFGRQVEVVYGGESRHESEAAGVAHLAQAVADGEIDVILVHDGARPFVTRALIRALVTAARAVGAAVPGVADEALVHGDINTLAAKERLDCRLIRVQTPQAFRAPELVTAYVRAEQEGFRGTDTAACVERYAELPIAYVAGDPRNLKITFPEDLFLAEQILRASHYEVG